MAERRIDDTIHITVRVPRAWGKPLAKWAEAHGTSRSALLRDGAKLMIEKIKREQGQVKATADLAFP